MEERHLGRSGLSVSRLGLGTMTWGGDTDPEDAAEQLMTFVEAGGSLLDTADVYCGGDSERVIGELVGQVVDRDDLVIATKAVLTAEGTRDASRRHLLRALDASLDRLGVDHVDLWQLHAYDSRTPMEETLSALDDAVASGRARYAGVSNYAAWQLATAATWQRAWPGRTPIVSTQAEYSLLRRDAEDDLVPASLQLGVGLLPYSPLGRGVLTGKYRTGIPADSRAASAHYAEFVQPYLNDRCARIVESVSTAAEGLGVSPLAVALGWVRDQPGVVAPIVGARTVKQLAVILEAEEITLPGEIREALDDISSDDDRDDD
ncbi:aldo/keto reductase [Actinoallomurus iriomotensis]|uniref:Oxidoreductase n=1 Tax=Actinoallomurus iriomotensis TaxID=478107 RepID=A0A9W6VZV0_9ACTN|nr:aldo/keto reductase [Actinoallomurus iriomotensis]GLY91598.1 oxidoreductase [Actinoallomurus iriomotensis]